MCEWCCELISFRFQSYLSPRDSVIGPGFTMAMNRMKRLLKMNEPIKPVARFVSKLANIRLIINVHNDVYIKYECINKC